MFDRNVNVIDVTLPGGIKTHVEVKVNNRARRINLRIDVRSSIFTLTCPTETSIPHLKNFLENNVNWLLDQLSKFPKESNFGMVPYYSFLDEVTLLGIVLVA